MHHIPRTDSHSPFRLWWTVCRYNSTLQASCHLRKRCEISPFVNAPRRAWGTHAQRKNNGWSFKAGDKSASTARTSANALQKSASTALSRACAAARLFLVWPPAGGGARFQAFQQRYSHFGQEIEASQELERDSCGGEWLVERGEALPLR